MIRSMSAAVTGMRGHQQKLDVVGNNIANVNTVGFKKSQARFSDLFSQTIQGATRPGDDLGGINPSQIGLGMRVSSIVNIHSQGAITTTDRITDLAIEGGGFFVISPDEGDRLFYTRDGSFGRDANGDLVSANGMKVIGWEPGPGAGQGVPDTVMNIPLGDRMEARATANMNFSGNLDARFVGDPTGAVLGNWNLNPAGFYETPAGFITGMADATFNYDLTYTAQVAATNTIANFGGTGEDLTITYNGLDAAEANGIDIVFDGQAVGPGGETAVWSQSAGPGTPYDTLTITIDNGTFYDDQDLEGFIQGALANSPLDDMNAFTVTGTSALPVYQLAAVGDTETTTLAGGQTAHWTATGDVDAVYFYDPTVPGFGTITHGGITTDLDVLTAPDPADGDTINIASDTYEYFMFDSLGRRYEVDFSFTSTAQNVWDYELQVRDELGNLVAPLTGDTGRLVFDDNGALIAAQSTIPNIQFNPDGADLVDVEPQFGPITQLAGDSTLLVREQDGYAAGELFAFNIGRDGMIVGSYTNGLFDDLGQIAMSYFSNPEGLQKEGGNLFSETANSGEARIGLPGTEGRGLMQSSALELSNVDLAYEFTELITTSRGFQANTRVVTTSDEVLVEVVNMKR